MPKVQELARELGLTSQEVMRHLQRIGHPAAGHTSVVEDEAAQRLRNEFGNGFGVPGAGGRYSAVRPAPPPPPPPPPPASGEASSQTTAAAGEATTVLPAGTDTIEAEPEKDVPAAPTKKKKSWTHQLAELPLLILFAFIIAVIIKTFLAQAFFIPSESMVPTLRIGDRVLVEKVSYRLGAPERGQVIVFAKDVLGEVPDLPWHQDARNFLRELLGLPTGKEEDYIKRIVAVGGDTLRYFGTPRQLEINGQAIDEPYIKGDRDRSSQDFTSRDCQRFDMAVEGGACVVPDDQVFVMGDNRANSADSRSFGPVPEDKIIGRAFVVIWPPKDIGGI
jgi:signal peptidase I